MARESSTNDAPDAAAPAKQPSAWGPVIAMLVLMPAITFGMAQFVIIPKIRAAILPPVGATDAGHGAAAAKGAHGGHGKETAAKSGGHGHGHGKETKSGHGKHGGGEASPAYDFDSVVVNLSGTMGTRYLKTSFTVLSGNANLKTIIEENKKQLLDVAITVLSARSLADLEQPGAKNTVRSELAAQFNQALNSDLIEQIYFSEFVVQ